MVGRPKEDEEEQGMILVDTSVWVDFLRGINSKERRVLHRLIEEDEEAALTEIIVTEILQGISKDDDFEKLKKCLLEFPIYKPKGIETYIRAAEIYRECRKSGKTVRKTIDCLIAAICIENDLILLHKDNDFDRIEACTELKCYRA